MPLIAYYAAAVLAGFFPLFFMLGGNSSDRSTTLADLPPFAGNPIARPPVTISSRPIDINSPIVPPGLSINVNNRVEMPRIDENPNPFFQSPSTPPTPAPLEISEPAIPAIGFGLVALSAFSLRRKK